MNTKHTPGPWHAVQTRQGIPYVVDDHNGFHQMTIATCPDCHQDVEQDRANAVLIAAAPNMLAAFQAIVAILDGHQPIDIPGALMIARNAIAQATGNSIPAPSEYEQQVARNTPAYVDPDGNPHYR